MSFNASLMNKATTSDPAPTAGCALKPPLAPKRVYNYNASGAGIFVRTFLIRLDACLAFVLSHAIRRYLFEEIAKMTHISFDVNAKVRGVN